MFFRLIIACLETMEAIIQSAKINKEITLNTKTNKPQFLKKMK